MRLIAACGAALVSGAVPLAAQEVSAAAGISQVRYADSLDGTAGSLGARVEVGGGLKAAVLDGAYSRFRGGGWAFQAAARGTALFETGGGPLALGFAGGAALNDFEGGVASGTGAAGPLLVVRHGRLQTVVGVSLGAFRTVDTVWSVIGSGSLRWQWAATRAFHMDAGVVGSLADSLRFADATLQLRATSSRVRGGLLGGLRVGDLSDGPWGSVELAWDAIGPLSVEIAAGRYPEDITGFADGLYAQMAVRIHVARPSRRPPPPPISVQRVGSGRVRLTFTYRPENAELRIAADWTGWSPTGLTRESHDRWSLEVALAPGVYRFALVDGRRWVVPRGTTTVDDDFGGTVGLLVIP